MYGTERLQEFLTRNDGMALLTAAAIACGSLLLVAVVKRVALQRLGGFAAKTSSGLDDALVDAIRATRLWLLLFPALFVGAQSLDLANSVSNFLRGAATVALFLQAGLWTSRLVRLGIHYSRVHNFDSSEDTTASLGALNFVGQAVLWSIIALMALDNLGVNVTALVAGLGVGGIAVALAVQNILGDLFASLSIIIDKPFVVGDFIIIDNYMGTVEHIGVKTTRVRSLGGEQIIFANNDLLTSRVRNYKRMYERRVVFQFGVLYQTKPEQLEKIPSVVKDIIAAMEKVRFERAHFFKFGDSSLDFEVVYWVLDPDYGMYMDIQQAINLKLLESLEKEGVGFAYPTRSVVIEKPLEIRRAATGRGA